MDQETCRGLDQATGQEKVLGLVLVMGPGKVRDLVLEKVQVMVLVMDQV